MIDARTYDQGSYPDLGLLAAALHEHTESVAMNRYPVKEGRKEKVARKMQMGC